MNNEKPKFEVGDIVVSYERELFGPSSSPYDYMYMIDGICRDHNTNELIVIYKFLYEPDQPSSFHKGNIVCEPLKEFESEVDREKYPHVSQKYKFEKVPCGKKYQQKLKDVTAVKWNGSNLKEVRMFCHKLGLDDIVVNLNYQVIIKLSPIGQRSVFQLYLSKNDYLIHNSDGTLGTGEARLFEELYEETE